jgi:tRNA pseudouridine65 synthase
MMELGLLSVIPIEGDLVVIGKPSGLSVHRGWDASPDDLIRRARAQLGCWVYPVHRLDRGTSGALLVALNEARASWASSLFREHVIEKRYVALVRGPLLEAGVVDHPVRLREDGPERVDAVTQYAPLGVARDRYTLVELKPETGRLHQLRRHMKHLSRPILGDTTYGDGRENRALRELGLHRLALHALSLTLPMEDRVVRVRIGVPADLLTPLRTLGFSDALLGPLTHTGLDSTARE